MNIVRDVPLFQCLAERHFHWLWQILVSSIIPTWVCSSWRFAFVLKPNYFSCLIHKCYTKTGNSKQDLTIFTDQILDFNASNQSSFCVLCWWVSESRKKSSLQNFCAVLPLSPWNLISLKPNTIPPSSLSLLLSWFSPSQPPSSMETTAHSKLTHSPTSRNRERMGKVKIENSWVEINTA